MLLKHAELKSLVAGVCFLHTEYKHKRKKVRKIFPWELALKLSLNNYLEGVTEHFSFCGSFNPVAF